MKRFFLIAVISTLIALNLRAECAVLDKKDFRHYVEYFNRIDPEPYKNYFSNDSAWNFIKDNVPFFECPDKEVEKTYYFRWWSYRKHIKQTPVGFIITEFLPDVRWAKKYNSICCPAGFHFYEGRWLADNRYLNDYLRFWFTDGDPRQYSFWIASSALEYYKVTGDEVALKLIPNLVSNYRAWEPGEIRRKNFVGRNPDGLFSMKDTFDGMEFQIGGSGKRPTINSYQYGDAVAITELARLAGNKKIEKEFRKEADRMKELVQQKLWDKEAQFFKTIAEKTDSLVDVRELQGYTPWMMHLPDDNAEYAQAWKFLLSSDGFRAPYGLTTAEQTHPKFMKDRKHHCSWDGPSWPFSTSITLIAMSNLLHDYNQNVVTNKDFMEEFVRYSRAQRLTNEQGDIIPWVDESLNPYTGDWRTRSEIKRKAEAGLDNKIFIERGKEYNHSSYCDILISGVVGIRPQTDNTLIVDPLVDATSWPWFCLDDVSYKGHKICVVYDRDGTHYNREKGLTIYVDGQVVATSKKLQKFTISL